jgi:hypothetical protein
MTGSKFRIELHDFMAKRHPKFTTKLDKCSTVSLDTKIPVFWEMMSCNLGDVDGCFEVFKECILFVCYAVY